MGKAFLHNSGGGGGGLNFRMVGGTSAPSSPKVNDFWVNTSAEITGYIFSATQPEAPMEGVVWIKTKTYSPAAFNVLKKNTLIIYPTDTMQYISGAWVEKTSHVYINGSWVRVITDFVFYANGEFHENAGFKEVLANASVTYEATHIAITTVANKENQAYFQFGKIDLSGYSKIEAVYSNESGKSMNGVIFVSDTEVSSITYADADVQELFSSGDLTLTLDVSNLSYANGCYVYAGFNSNGKRYTSSFSGLKLKSVKLIV